MFTISPLVPDDLPDMERLLDAAFGADRRRRSSYRYREEADALPGLGFVAREAGRLVGGVRQWPVLVGDAGFPATLLGPLAVSPPLRGAGVGRALARRSLDAARGAGVGHVFLIGDREYYARLGFSPAAEAGIGVPGEPADRVHHMALDPSRPPPPGELRPWRAADGAFPFAADGCKVGAG